jgi:pyruvate formate lyase activating enzyme
MDFPGRLAAVVFTQGCDLCCRYCHNPSLRDRSQPNATTMVAFEEFLKKRRGFLEGIVVCGGEPTLWDELPVLLSFIHRLGFAVKLDTNGMHPRRIHALLEQNLIDYLAVDVKAQPGVVSQWLCGHGHQAEKAMETLACAKAKNLRHEARTTIIAGIHDLEALTWIGIRLAQIGTKRWYLQDVHSEGILDRTFPCVPPHASVVQAAVKNARDLGLEVSLRPKLGA